MYLKLNDQNSKIDKILEQNVITSMRCRSFAVVPPVTPSRLP